MTNATKAALDMREAAAKLADCGCGSTAREKKFCGLIDCGHDIAAAIRALPIPVETPDQGEALRAARAELIEANAELIYLRMYGKDGAFWPANDSKEVWRAKARALPASPALAAIERALALLDAATPAPDERRSVAARDVLAERERQKTVEGWTPEHDDNHKDGTLALAACCYSLPREERKAELASGVSVRLGLWPWDSEWWKPKDRRRDLVRAGALILAEIERLDRLAAPPKPPAVKETMP